MINARLRLCSARNRISQMFRVINTPDATNPIITAIHRNVSFGNVHRIYPNASKKINTRNYRHRNPGCEGISIDCNNFHPCTFAAHPPRRHAHCNHANNNICIHDIKCICKQTIIIIQELARKESGKRSC